MKIQALLFYLVMTRQSHPRMALATLLWGGSPEKNARASLRKALQQLRQILPNHLLLVDQSVALRTDASVWVDAVHFADQIAQAETRNDMAMLEESIRHYRGDFLSGFLVRNAPDFEHWQATQQVKLREQLLGALQTLSRHWMAQNHLANAIATTRRIIELEPWREEVHRQLMKLLARNGERGAALAHFELCREALQRELDVGPSAATLDLVAKIRTDTVPHGQPMQPTLLRSHRTARSNTSSLVATAVEFPLVGREREWQLVQECWHKLHQPHFLCIGGEAGIGKSRLAEELLVLAERAGASVARTRAHALQGQLAYGSIIDWLRSAPLQNALAQLEPVWLEELARLLPELLINYPTLSPPEPLRESWQRKRFFDALCYAFTAVEGPLLLVLDDLQWSDVDTLEWIQYLVESTTNKLLVVGTVRTDEIDEAHPLHRVRQQLERDDRFTELPLSSLTASATTALATHVSQQQLADDATKQLFLETAGNPLFVIETMRITAEKAIATPSPLYPEHNTSQEQRFVPAKVYRVLQARLTQLSPTAQTIAQLGATIGRSFDMSLLANAAGLNENAVLTALDELWQRRIIYEVDAIRFDFSHDRIRDVAYAEISPIKRRLLHRAVADALLVIHDNELDTVAGQLAVHYEVAGSLEQAVTYYQRAADGARQLFAHHEAIKYRQHALASIRQLPRNNENQQTEINLLLALGNAWQNSEGLGSPSAYADLRAAHELAQQFGTPMQRVDAMHALASYDRVRGNWSSAHEWALRVYAESLAMGDPVLVAQAHFGIASALMRRGNLEEANSHFAQISLYLPLENSPNSNIGYLTRFSYCLWLLGFPERALQQVNEALQLRRKYDLRALPIPLHHYSSIALFCGDVATVDRLSTELVALATKRQDDFSLRWGMIYRGWLLVQQGQLAEGIRIMRENADEHRARENYFYECVWRSLLAEAYILAGDFDAAFTEIDSTLTYAETSGDCHWNAQLLKLRGDALQASDAPATEVERYYQLAIDTACEQSSRSLELRATTSLCRLWQRQGKVAEAYQLLSNIYGWYTEGFDTLDLREAKVLLDELGT
ncbi:MAG: BTAD domain-containing putative transcriptional regulator [Caldilineaceae bacterium]